MTGHSWLDEMDPPVPPAFKEWLLVEAEPPMGVDALVSRAEAAVSRALQPTDRARSGAFELLAADALLTYAAAATLDEPGDPVETLLHMSVRVARGP